MKTGKEFLAMLHPVEQKNWEEAFKLDSLNSMLPDIREWFLAEEYPSLNGFLASSFSWKDSPQGREYWSLLSQK